MVSDNDRMLPAFACYEEQDADALHQETNKQQKGSLLRDCPEKTPTHIYDLRPRPSAPYLRSEL